MTDWKPIDEFPKDAPDGTEALVFGTWNGEVAGERDEPGVYLCERWRNGWIVKGGDYYTAYVMRPTHFALVAAPAAVES